MIFLQAISGGTTDATDEEDGLLVDLFPSPSSVTSVVPREIRRKVTT
jgi:hypothetical protein